MERLKREPCWIGWNREHNTKVPYSVNGYQVEFDHENARGMMVGPYCPSFMGGLNSIGWHFHFITEDLKQGGHVLQVSVDEAVAELDATSGFELMLPEDDAEFQTMDLSRNMDEAIHRAETATSEDAATATSEDTP